MGRGKMRALLLSGALLCQAAPQEAGQPAGNPIRKVVKLLEEMQSAMDKEQKEDQAMFTKMECWCNKNRKEKTSAVAAAEKRLKQLDGLIEEAVGTIAKSEATKKAEEEKIAETEKSTAEAKELRAKDAAAAEAEQQEFRETLDALERALKALGKAHGEGGDEAKAAFLQVASARGVHEELQKDLLDVIGSLKTRPGFLQQGSLVPEGSPVPPAGSSQPAETAGGASAGIFGMMKQMKIDMNRDLQTSIDNEATAVAAHENLLAESEKIIAACHASWTAAVKAHGDAKIAEANGRNEHKNLTEQVGADQKFLVNMEQKCKEAADGFAQRSKDRGDEIAAVGKALEVLTSDEAREQFAKTSFVQVSASEEKGRRDRARATLMNVAKKSGNARLALVAVSLVNEAFAKVVEAMDKLAAELKKDQAEEAAERDQCNEDLAENDKNTQETQYKLDDTNAGLDDANASIERLTQEIADLNAEIASTQSSMQQAAVDRKEENAAFQTTVQDQKVTITILQKALGVLKEFYGQAFVQQPQQGTYKKSGGAPGALGLLNMIIADSENLIREATADEQHSQQEYETLVTDSNDSVTRAQASVVQKETELATAGVTKEELDAAKTSTETQMTDLKLEKSQLDKQCTVLLEVFEKNQAGRQEEIESIVQAKTVLEGIE